MSTNTWTGTAADGLWSTDGNWSLGTSPTSADDVVIAGADAITWDVGVYPASLTMSAFTGSLANAGFDITISGDCTFGTFTLTGLEGHQLAVGGNFHNEGTSFDFASDWTLTVTGTSTAGAITVSNCYAAVATHLTVTGGVDGGGNTGVTFVGNSPRTNASALLEQLAAQLAACSSWPGGDTSNIWYPSVDWADADLPLAVIEDGDQVLSAYASGAGGLKSGSLKVALHYAQSSDIGAVESIGRAILDELLAQAPGIIFRSGSCGLAGTFSTAEQATDTGTIAVVLTLDYGLTA